MTKARCHFFLGWSIMLAVFIATVVFVMPRSYVAAHVLMNDATGTRTATLHVDPGDNFVTGESCDDLF